MKWFYSLCRLGTVIFSIFVCAGQVSAREAAEDGLGLQFVFHFRELEWENPGLCWEGKPWLKLWEGSTFLCVCLSEIGWGWHSPRWARLEMMNSRGSKNENEQEMDVGRENHFCSCFFSQFCFVPCLKCTITIFLCCCAGGFCPGSTVQYLLADGSGQVHIWVSLEGQICALWGKAI